MTSNLLDQIREPNDIRKIPREQYGALAQEIREFLIEKVGENGGHLASNLVIVELTMALHLVMTFPRDKIVWDVGHQAYVHKILTGRKDGFDNLRQFEGLSGFPKRTESRCDAFGTGHGSTSVSAALGLAAARDLRGGHEKICAVIGDGALSGGMAYEALNNAARRQKNFVIILNDNTMSISKNVGGMATYLAKVRTNPRYKALKVNVENLLTKIPKVGWDMAVYIKNQKEAIKKLAIPNMLFEDMGLTYIGPIDGHDVIQMRDALRGAFLLEEPVIVHVVTKKGKGYPFAEQNPSKFHGIGPFDPETGEPTFCGGTTWTQVFAEALLAEARQNPKVCAITAAMASGTGVDEFEKEFPERTFDVGIAEEHAVTFAAGLAAAGYRPAVAIYSTFLQRAYDQILHDTALQRLPVFFALDRAGFVAHDGETHQGIYDLSYLNTIPRMTVCAPANEKELREMVHLGLTQKEGPFAVRYPRGAACTETFGEDVPVEKGKAQVVAKGRDVTLIALGRMTERAARVREVLQEEDLDVGLINARFLQPLDEETILAAAAESRLIVTLEDNERTGGFGEKVTVLLKRKKQDCDVLVCAYPETYLPHGDTTSVESKYHMDTESIVNKIFLRLSK
ncbi:MAG: 1-deoxy-D-xylulose-5-phosphate synthase [Lachnospiraceae bacterium]|nr:1-deoxy-D-xylulose-5-phosphate synthase [Lachnospiraceae bacterium]